jgi:hypothetical protein
MLEVADFHPSVFTAVDAILLFFSLYGHFPKLDIGASSFVSRSMKSPTCQPRRNLPRLALFVKHSSEICHGFNASSFRSAFGSPRRR